MKLPALVALAVVAAFAWVRYEIYRAMPVDDFFAQFDLWCRRDAVMSLPRLAAFLVCAWYTRRAGGFARWGWSAALTTTGAVILALTAVTELLFMLAFHAHGGLSLARLLQGWLITVPVALYEEAAFRSLLFLSLRESRGPRAAAIISSLIFVVSHAQAVGLESWPTLFAFGFGACAALHRGAGLWWLVLMHWAVDSLWYTIYSGPPFPGAFAAWIGIVVVLLSCSWSLLGEDRRLAELGIS